MPSNDFVFNWTKKLGFRDDPFQPVLLTPIDKFFTGYDKERQKINLFILEKYPFGVVSGENGSGKTTLLQWVLEQLNKNNTKVSFINATRLSTERDLIEKLTSPLLNIYEKSITKTHKKLRIEEIGRFIHSKLKKKKTLVVIIDNVGDLPRRYISLFKYFFDHHINVQLIISGSKEEIASSGIKTISEKDYLNIHMTGLNLEETTKMLEKRVKHFGQEDIFPFQEEMIKAIHVKSKGNAKALLTLCREKVIKLTLDKKYIRKELARMDEIRRKRIEEKRENESEKKTFSIKVSDEEGDDDLDVLSAPDFTEQEIMLADLTGKKIKSVAKNEKQINDLDIEKLKSSWESEEKTEEIKENKPKKKKDILEDKKTEELLSKLAKEFEEK